MKEFEDYCEMCGELLKDDDVIFYLDGPLIHQEECFLEWCLNVYGMPTEYATYKKDQKEWEEFKEKHGM